MNYWDSSALVSLFVEQPGSMKYGKVYNHDEEIITAWHAVTECASAFCRLRREERIEELELSKLLEQCIRPNIVPLVGGVETC